MIFNGSRYIGLVTLLVLVAVIGYGVYWFIGQSSERFTFAGQLKELENNEVLINGAFELNPGELAPDRLPLIGDLFFLVDNKTEFTKDDIQWPSDEEIHQMGTFEIKDLPHKKGPGSFDDLVAMFNAGYPVYITAEFPVAITTDVASVPASAVLYRVFSGAFPINNTGNKSEENE